MRDVYSRHYAAVSTGTCSHELGRRASDIVREARESVRLFIGAADLQEIAFFPTSFDAMSALATSYSQILKRSDEVILVDATDYCSRIWQTHSKPRRFSVSERADVSFPAIAPLVSAKTKLIMFRSASVFGNIHDMRDILEFLEATGIPIALDASDLLHYGQLRVQECGADFVFADCSSMGVPMAFLYGKKGTLAELPPAFGGEHSLHSYSAAKSYDFNNSNWGPIPERFEVGMSCLPSIASLKAIVDECNVIEPDLSTSSSLERHALYLYEQLRSCNKVEVYGSAERRAPFACFNIEGVDSSRVATELAKNGVYVRAGFHGVRRAHAELGISGSVRVDVNLKQHTKEAMDHFFQRLREVVEKLKS
ncbi:cysteine desulfurase Csd [Gracilaria domingensis]|nr:cysteine desulfurase Csd [Gracilaria domingensis]